MQQKLVQNSFITRGRAFGKKHRKGTLKVTPNIKKYLYYYKYLYLYIFIYNLYIYRED